MIIVKIMGGFASQVYKFFFGAKLAECLQTELVLDVSDYYDGYFRPYTLNLLNIPTFRTVCTREIEKKYPELIKIRNSIDMENMISNKYKGDYYIFREEPDYADFFWSHPEFEVDINTPYIKTLALKEPSPFVEAFVSAMENKASVALHIRRGDFVTLGQEGKISYYRAAIAWFYEQNPQTEFYFFSNDLPWVKEQFGFNNRFHYVHAQDEKKGDIEELFCMSYCNYRILSNYSGYGLLANTLSAVRNPNGYALIEEKKSNEYEYKGIEGSIKYFSQEQIKEYDLKYRDIKWEKCEDISARQQELNISKPKKEVDKEGEIYIITCERYSKWFRRGMFEIAVRLAENGYEVKYINLNDCLNQQQITTQAACNMDGLEYGFDIIVGNLEQVGQLVQENGNAMIVCDCEVPFSYTGQIILIKSRKADQCQKKWSMTLVRRDIKAGIKYIFGRKHDAQNMITLLDQYWEDTLMQDGNSNEDITVIFERVYKEIVEKIIREKE